MSKMMQPGRLTPALIAGLAAACGSNPQLDVMLAKQHPRIGAIWQAYCESACPNPSRGPVGECELSIPVRDGRMARETFSCDRRGERWLIQPAFDDSSKFESACLTACGETFDGCYLHTTFDGTVSAVQGDASDVSRMATRPPVSIPPRTARCMAAS